MRVIDITIIGRHLKATVDIGEPDQALGRDLREMMTVRGAATVSGVTVSCSGDEDLEDHIKEEMLRALLQRVWE